MDLESARISQKVEGDLRRFGWARDVLLWATVAGVIFLLLLLIIIAIFYA